MNVKFAESGGPSRDLVLQALGYIERGETPLSLHFPVRLKLEDGTTTVSQRFVIVEGRQLSDSKFALQLLGSRGLVHQIEYDAVNRKILS